MQRLCVSLIRNWSGRVLVKDLNVAAVASVDILEIPCCLHQIFLFPLPAQPQGNFIVIHHIVSGQGMALVDKDPAPLKMEADFV